MHPRHSLRPPLLSRLHFISVEEITQSSRKKKSPFSEAIRIRWTHSGPLVKVPRIRSSFNFFKCHRAERFKCSGHQFDHKHEKENQLLEIKLPTCLVNVQVCILLNSI